MLEVVANMFAYKGRHWFDAEKKKRFMEFEGYVFVWNPYSEHWCLYKESEEK